MKPKIYTESDIQDYLDGTFNGDAQDLLDFIRHDPEASANFMWQQQIKAMLETPQPMLTPDLSEQIIQKIQTAQALRNSRKARPLFFLIIFSGVALLIYGLYIFQSLDIFSSPGARMGILMATLMGMFIWLFSQAEHRKKEKQFAQLV